MLNVFKDEHSLGYYRRIGESVSQHKIFEALSLVRQMSREGAIRKTPGAAFTAIIKGGTSPHSTEAHE